MAICYICKYQAHSISKLIMHFKVIHKLGKNSLYHCKESGCVRRFSSIDSFRKHFSKMHNFGTETSAVHSLNTKLNTSESLSGDKYQCNDEVRGMDVEYNSQFDHCSADNMNEFCILLSRASTKFICKMYDEATLTRKQVLKVIAECKNFIFSCTEYMKDCITKIFDKYVDSILPKDKNLCLSMFANFNNVFETLDTEYKIFKHLGERGLFIKPVEITIGQRLEQVGSRTIQKDVKIQYIPPAKTLKGFFELSNVYSQTIDYMQKLNHDNSDVISNVMQSVYWNEKISKFSSNLVLPLYLYYDEYETGNPLGAHASIHKLGAIYFSIASLPPREQGFVNNIFLAMLMHSSDLQEFGGNLIFSQLIDDLNKLETEGIIIDLHGQTIKMNFCIALILGDNLGLHTLLGFAESFQANFYCRFCKCPRLETQTLCKEVIELIRTKDTYKVDLESNDITKTGIKAECSWNRIKSFEVTSNFAVDIMHDVFEGVAGFDIILLLDQFINRDKYFSLNVLNSRIKHFNFGFAIKNRPGLISADNIKNKHLKMSASEMKCLVLYLGVIVGDLVPINNKHWELYIKIREIVSIISAKHITNKDHKLLKELISEHHEIIINTFNDRLKPKHHHMVHYSSIMQKVGPLVNMPSMRFESKHKLSKLSANVVSSRVDICKTLATKNQLKFCYRLFTGEGFCTKITMGKSVEIKSISDLIPTFLETCKISQFTAENFEGSCRSTKHISVNSTTYHINNAIYVDINNTDGMPVLGIINHIFVSNKNDILFFYKQVKVLSFCRHLQAYQVIKNDFLEMSCILQSELIHYAPLVSTTLANGSSFISLP